MIDAFAGMDVGLAVVVAELRHQKSAHGGAGRAGHVRSAGWASAAARSSRKRSLLALGSPAVARASMTASVARDPALWNGPGFRSW